MPSIRQALAELENAASAVLSGNGENELLLIRLKRQVREARIALNQPIELTPDLELLGEALIVINESRYFARPRKETNTEHGLYSVWSNRSWAAMKQIEKRLNDAGV